MLEKLEREIKDLESGLSIFDMAKYAELGALRKKYAEALDTKQNKEINEL